jgi:hypothetical protein
VIDLTTRLDLVLRQCEPAEVESSWLPAAQQVALQYWPYMEAGHARDITMLLRRHSCTGKAAESVNGWLDFLEADAARDWPAVAHSVESLLANRGSKEKIPVVLARELLMADLFRGGMEAVRTRVLALGETLPDDPSIDYLRTISGAR